MVNLAFLTLSVCISQFFHSVSNRIIEYKYDPLLNFYLEGLKVFEVRSLKELIVWNEAHRDLELSKGIHAAKHQFWFTFKISRILESVSPDSCSRQWTPQELYLVVKAHLKKFTASLKDVFESADFDLVVVPTDSRICSLASASGKRICSYHRQKF